ncbi:tetratricopeptide repeat protein [Azoarcus sp. DN11]|uniref:tetratricopeptide repeat protein n=1 Tax=Azoarcus sp. DN11 TaxID=356837 RepID=UPI000EAD2FC7|nr:tetratricopeptide repeat protein [Azoarcus sp. DN11]
MFLVGAGEACAGDVQRAGAPEPAVSAADSGEPEYRHALSMNEQGRGKDAWPVLESLANRFPQVLRYRLDFIAVASASGEHARALAQTDGRLEAQAPRYVVDALFRSALAVGDEAASERLHALIAERFGPDTDAGIRLARLYLQRGQDDKGLKLAEALLARAPGRPDVLDLRAYALRQAGRLTEALLTYEEMQRLAPDNRDAPKAIAMILADIDAAQEAARHATGAGVALTLEESLRLANNRAAQYLHWAVGDRNTPKERFTNADRAIAVLTAALEDGTAGKAPPATLTRLRRDLVVAYQARNRWQDAVNEYERLIEAGDSVPEYVALPAASSYESVGRYREAEALLRTLVEQSPDALHLRRAQFYALADLERYDDAQYVIDDLVQRLAHKDRCDPGEAATYTAALITQAMLSAYRGKLDDAQLKLDTVLAAAPASTDAQEAAGVLASWRGQPRQAEESFRIVLGEQPDRLDSRIGLASARMDRGDAAFFRQTVDELSPGYPELHTIRDARRRLALQDSSHVTGNASFGRDADSIAGNRTREYDLRVDSPPFADDRWRVFARYRSLWSGPVVSTSGDSGSAGLKYTVTDWSTEIEAGSAGYGRIETDHAFSDRWSASAAVEKNQFFRQARAVATGVTADSAALALRWRQDETRDVAGGYRVTRFSDNERTEAHLAASQNLLTDFDRRLTASVRVAGQNNSQPNVAYFSPRRQLEAGATLIFEFMQWRDVDTKKSSLWHRFWLTAGQVDQSGFGAMAMSNYGYGQDIAFSDAFRIGWRISRTRYPFDGVISSYYTGTIGFEGYF